MPGRNAIATAPAARRGWWHAPRPPGAATARAPAASLVTGSRPGYPGSRPAPARRTAACRDQAHARQRCRYAAWRLRTIFLAWITTIAHRASQHARRRPAPRAPWHARLHNCRQGCPAPVAPAPGPPAPDQHRTPERNMESASWLPLAPLRTARARQSASMLPGYPPGPPAPASARRSASSAAHLVRTDTPFPAPTGKRHRRHVRP